MRTLVSPVDEPGETRRLCWFGQSVCIHEPVAVVLDEDRPKDCNCGEWNSYANLPCWACPRDGFTDPASAGSRDEPRRSEPPDFAHSESTGSGIRNTG